MLNLRNVNQLQLQCLSVKPTLWTFDQICFGFKSLGLEFVVLSLWDAFSDERPDLSFVSHNYKLVNLFLDTKQCKRILSAAPWPVFS
jgi:hypothetical protein